jgi:hypothetical protein
VAGTANTGGGGGGGASSNPPSNAPPTGGTAMLGRAGGSGVVILRFPGSTCASVAPGSNSIATLPAPAGGCKVATFTVTGTLTTG